MAPVISTMSNFIKGGSWLDVSGSRCLGMQTNNCPLMSRPGAQKRFLCHYRLTLTRLFCMIRRVAAPLHATSFPIIRHQRPVLPPTAARIVCRLKAAEVRTPPIPSPTHPSPKVLWRGQPETRINAGNICHTPGVIATVTLQPRFKNIGVYIFPFPFI